MGTSNENVGYNDVRTAVEEILDRGVNINDISLRMIREAIGHGSLSTISKHFGPLKVRIDRGEAIATSELTEVDMEALRDLVADIVGRRTFLARKEKDDNAQAMSDLLYARDADLAINAEIIEDLEHQVKALEDDNGVKQLVIKGMDSQIARLEGMVEALHATIKTFGVRSGEAAAKNAVPIVHQPLAIKTDHLSGGQVEMPLNATGNHVQSDASGGQG